MTRKVVALLVGLFVLIVSTDALAEPDAGPDGGAEMDAGPPTDVSTHVLTPFEVTTDAGGHRRFAPSWIVPEPVWSKIDVELKRLQTTETRLGAENASLRASAGAGGFGWGTAAAVAAALAAGILGGRMLF